MANSSCTPILPKISKYHSKNYITRIQKFPVYGIIQPASELFYPKLYNPNIQKR